LSFLRGCELWWDHPRCVDRGYFAPANQQLALH
jgi:hypothetical protein